MKKYLVTFIYLFFMSLPVFAITDSGLEHMNMDWWKNFNDEHLIQNLLKVYENNYDLKNAALKIQANEQVAKMQFTQELPFVTFSADISRDLKAARQQFGEMQIPTYSQNNFYFPITAGYEIDIWGKNRLKTKSKKQQLEMAKQAQRATYISLTSNFVSDYFNLIKTDKLLEIQKELVGTQKEILSMTKSKFEIGLAPVTEVLYQDKILSTLKEEENNYIKSQEVLTNNLKVYLADFNDNVKRTPFEKVVVLENIPQKIDTEIIEKRPDYLQEEANIKRIGFDVKVAKKEFLPSFTIFGQIGLNAYTLSTLCKSPSQFFTAGILPSFDLFSGGRKLAFMKMQKFRYEEALNNYQKIYLNAANEINSSLVDYKTTTKNYIESQDKFSKECKLYYLAKEKRNIGSSSNLNVLSEKEIYLSTQKELVVNKINTILSTISLYKATGGVDLYKLNADKSKL
ncbi:MAG: TolC family protein [Candidatus Gastranaerophilales bacterium]|nr:TolC family protein [Candidatus Gastranaerophilales bacterium]